VALRGYLQDEVAQDFADGLLSRREALRRLGLLGLGLPGAGALLAACGGNRDGDGAEDRGDVGSTTTTAATTSTATDGAEPISFGGSTGELGGAWAAPADPVAAVLVIHANRGLTPHIRDVVGRLAGDGYAALAVDLLSSEGGTASLSDPAAAPAALAGLPEEELVADLRAGVDELERRVPDHKLGAIGFCFGGALAWTLLDVGESRLAAVIPFYGPSPERPDFSGADAAVLGIYAELDARVNESRDRARAALEAAGLTHEIRTFAGVDHGFFNNDALRYDADAAAEAYTAVLDWFELYLATP
jgi:carboxymethylenebutenolidase